jgi:LysM repeat protein
MNLNSCPSGISIYQSARFHMADAITSFENIKRVEGPLSRWIRMALTTVTIIVCLTGLPPLAGAMESDDSGTTEPPEAILAEFESRVAAIWGRNNVWTPSPKVWVQYEADLGERSAVDFEKGVAHLQILLKSSDDPLHEDVLAHLCQGVGNLVLGEATDPVQMVANQASEEPAGISAASLPVGKEVRVYIVRQGDTLWTIAKRFRMKTETLVQLNGLDADKTLTVGRPIKVIVLSSHDLALDSVPRPPASEPVLLDQIRMVDGSPVPPWLVRDFAAEVVRKQPPGVENVFGDDGIERLAVTVTFKLVKNHLEVRARKFQPLVLAHAEKHNLDPALIMAMIHTESMFNPRARSSTPAYGLMQLVPHTGGREAYRKIYGQKQKLTSQYLYDPENNIELGTAYFSILKNRYMRSILDPTSRRYCAVAAYNAGASNVGWAFISKKSINQATPVINRLSPQEVYARLVDALPMKESRAYVRKVLNRVRLYSDW